MIANAMAGVVYRIAATMEDRKAAFHLAHQVYVKAELDTPKSHQIRLIAQHLLPTTEVFIAGASKRKDVLATVTLVADGGLGLPMDAIYEREVDQFRRAGRRIAEVSCLAESQEHFESSVSVVIKLMGLMAQCAKHRGIQDLLIAVHPHHVKFYERFIAFQKIGEEKNYEKVLNNPAVAMALDLSRLHIDHAKVYQRFFGKPFPEEQLRSNAFDPWSPEYLEQMSQLRTLFRAQDEEALNSAGRLPQDLAPVGSGSSRAA